MDIEIEARLTALEQLMELVIGHRISQQEIRAFAVSAERLEMQASEDLERRVQARRRAILQAAKPPKR